MTHGCERPEHLTLLVIEASLELKSLNHSIHVVLELEVSLIEDLAHEL